MANIPDQLVPWSIENPVQSHGQFNHTQTGPQMTASPRHRIDHLGAQLSGQIRQVGGGGPDAYNHYNTGWAWAFDTPFSWTKQVVSHFGGTKQGMAISWPKVIKDKGGVRHQFHHVIDIVPTILEAAGIRQPEVVDGIPQTPMDGVSMLYTFDARNADAPSTRKTQYFEMMGQYALYHEGWLLSTKVNRAPWEAFGAANPDPLNNQVFQLYDLTKDFTQSNDIAAQHPEKVAELRREIVKIESIIHSMTKQERRNPKLMNASRKKRVARGAGVEVQDINRLLKQFTQMQKMMKKMKGGGMAKMMRAMKGRMPPGGMPPGGLPPGGMPF